MHYCGWTSLDMPSQLCQALDPKSVHVQVATGKQETKEAQMQWIHKDTASTIEYKWMLNV